MKKHVFYALLFCAVVLISSCGTYKEPCEGVVQINISNPNS